MSITLVVSLLWITHLTVFAQEVPESDNTPASTGTTETPSEELPYKLGEILIQYDETSFTSLVREDESGSVEVPGGLLDTTDIAPAPIGVVNEFLQASGVQNPRVIKRINSLNVELVSIGEGMDPLTIIDRMKASPVEGVVLAQPNFIYQSLQSSSTTGPDTRRNDAWHLKAIQLKDAWDFVADNPHTDTGTVTIGVIDNGIDFTDTDLTNKKWTSTTCVDNAGATVTGGCPHGGYDVYTNPHDNNPKPKQTDGTTDPYNTHGTEVTSVLAGEYNNTYGTVGVAQSVGTDSAGALAFGHAIKIVGIRVGEELPPTTPNGRSIPQGTSAEIIEGIDFARRNDIDIINLSLAVQLEPNSCGAFKYTLNPLPRPRTSQWLVHQALENYGSGDNDREKGLAIIAAGNDFVESGGHKAGKDNNTIVFPADFASTVRMKNLLGFTTECWTGLANVISVGGTELNSQGDEEIWYERYDTVENKEGGTSYGDHITIAAPALSIPTSLDISAGTSFAAPQVAGVAALMLRVQPDLEPSAIKTKIKESADELPNLRNASIATQMSGTKTVNLAEGRRLNAYRAVVAALGGKTKQLKTLPTIPSLSSNTDYLTVSKPAQPYEVTSTPGNEELTVSWDTVFNAERYEIRWRAAGRNTTLTSWENIGAVTEKTITGLTNGTKYVVQVRGVNSVGKGEKAVIDFSKSTTPKAAPLSAPTDAMATPGDGQLTVMWNSVSNADSYEIRWRTKNNIPNPWNYTNVGTATDYTITNLTNGTKYVIHVRAKNSAGTSSHTTVDFGRDTTPMAPLPNAPTNIISVPENRQLTISWNAIHDADSYELRWRPTGTVPDPWGYSTVTATTHTIPDLINGTAYIVHVRAKNSTGVSEHTTIGPSGSTTTGSVLQPFPAPTNAAAVPGDRQITVSWDKVPEGNNYEIRWRAEGDTALTPWESVSEGATVKTITGLTNSVRHVVHIRVKSFTNMKTSTVARVTFSEETTPVDQSAAVGGIDADSDGLIEITNATELLNINYSIGTGGYKEGPNGSVSTNGCPMVDHDDDPETDTIAQCTGFELVNDIDLTGVEWTPIGTRKQPFNLVFEGNNHVISHLSISGNYNGGAGLFGRIQNALIRNLALSHVSITSTLNVGGLIGYSIESAVTDSYVTGLVAGEYDVGGLIGHSLRSAITNTYTAVFASGQRRVGGLIGSQNESVVTNSYYNKDISYSESGEHGEGKTFIQLYEGAPSADIFTGWSTAVWNFGTANQMPILKGSAAIPVAPHSDDADKDGLLEIATVAELLAIPEKIKTECSAPNCNGFELTGNLDLTGVTWIPITYTSMIFNGNNHTIANLNSRFSIRGGGLFDFVSHSLIKDIGITNINIAGGSSSTGGLINFSRESVISNSYITGSISGDFDVGGLIGCGVYNTIIDSHTTSSISGTFNIGGLVGYDIYSRITNSYTTGSVSGTYNIGGLAGFTPNSAIVNAYATGSVSGDYNIGGLVGNHRTGYILNAYAVGAVSGDRDTGGLIGSITAGQYDIAVLNSYWDKETTGQTSSAGSTGSTGKTTAQMKSGTPSTAIYTDWSTDIWNFGTSTEYPTLK